MLLQYGSSGSSVAQLQRDLNFCGYDAGAVDGDFGSQTKSAVIECQSYNGLDQDGIYSDITDGALMTEIKIIQQALKNNGYNITVDGAVGDETLNATKDYQSKNGLVVDGIVGANTLAKLKIKENVSASVSTPNFTQTVNTPVSTTDHGKKSAHIYVAPGHGTQTNGIWDSGCTDGNYTEANLVLAIAKVVVRNLRDWGITVTSEADRDNDLNMTYSVAKANNVGADYYISLHCDWNQAPTGTYPIIYPGSASGMKFANAVNASVMSRMGMTTRGILQRDDYEVSYTDMPACIFECGSIRADINKLLNVEKFGFAIAQGIYDAI